MKTCSRFAFIALLAFAPLVHALDFGTLKSRNPQPTPNELNVIRMLNGTWFVAGDYGSIAVRNPAGDWEKRESGHDRGLSGLAYGNGTYIATSLDYQAVLRSPDGLVWTRVSTSELPYNNYDVIFANGHFWTAGGMEGVASSADGLTWATTAQTNNSPVNGVAFGAGRYVAVGRDGFVSTSSDGTNWTAALQGIVGKTGLDDDFQMVRFVNNLFVAGGAQGLLVASPDGLDWSTVIDVGVDDWFTDVAFFNGVYYLPGRQGTVHYSTNLVDWYETSVASDYYGTLNTIETDGTRLIAAGENGFLVSSLDGRNWTRESTGTLAYFNDVTFGLGDYAAADTDGGIWTSPDAITWSPSYQDPGTAFVGIHTLPGRLAAVSFSGVSVVSSNGMDWGAHTIAASVRVNRTRSLENRIWAVGDDGFVASTTNGLDWIPTTAGTETLKDIAYGEGLYAVVSDEGSVLTSPDGTVWTPRLTGAPDQLLSVAYGAGRFIACTRTVGVAWRSEDGITWTNTGFTSPPYGANRLQIVNGEFVALAPYQGPRTSADGLTWNSMNPFTSASLQALLSVNGRLVVVGTYGLIMSDDVSTAAILSLAPTAGGQAELSWTGTGFTLQSSDQPDSGWSATADQDNPQTISLGDPHRFYRLAK